MERKDIPIRRTALADQGRETDLRNTTAEERLGMMEQLMLDAWAFKEGDKHVEPRLQRHVVRVIRGQR